VHTVCCKSDRIVVTPEASKGPESFGIDDLVGRAKGVDGIDLPLGREEVCARDPDYA